jgi:uncharacterized membrane protein
MRGTVGPLSLLCVLLVLPGAQAAYDLGSPLPHSGIRLAAIDNGEVGLSLFEANDPTAAQILGQNGAGSQSPDGTGSLATFHVDDVTYTTGGFNGAQRALPVQTRLNATNAVNDYQLGDVRVRLNVTLVRGAARFHLNVTNEGSVAHDFGYRQAWDLYLNGVDDGFHSSPYLWIPGEAGDLDPARFPGVYRGREQRFDQPAFNEVRMRRTPTGPDGGVHPPNLYARASWDPSKGGTPPERAVIASIKAYEQMWDYSVDPPPYALGRDPAKNNLLLLYWGFEHPLHLAPGATSHIVHWYGRSDPPAFLGHRVDASFTRALEGDNDPAQRLRFVEAGQTVEEPFEVVNGATLGPATPRAESYDLSLRPLSVPAGWTARLLGATGEADAPAVLSLGPGATFQGRLRIAAPAGAVGDDAARVEVVARQRSAGDVDPLRDRLVATLSATVAVVPRVKIGLTLDDTPLKVVAPGGSVRFNLSVANQGNLREPLPAILDVGGVLPTGWRATWLPSSRIDVERGATVPAELRLDVPTDELGGVRDLTLRARVAGRADANTTQVRVRVAAESQVELRPDATERLVPPGGSRTFLIDVINRGAEPAPLTLSADVRTAGPWGLTVLQPTVPSGGLPPGGRARLALVLRAPEDAPAGDRLEVPIVALDPATHRVLANASIVAIVDAASHLVIDADAYDLAWQPGVPLVLSLPVTNRGNVDENVTLDVVQAPRGLVLQVALRPLALAAGANGTLQLTLRLPPDAVAGDHDLVLRPQGEVDLNATSDEVVVRIRVPERRDLDVRLDRDRFEARPGERLLLHADITNKGNAPVALRIVGAPPGWTLHVPANATPLAPGDARRIEAALLVPAQASVGPYAFDLRTRGPDDSAAGPNATRRVQIELVRADLRIVRIEPAEHWRPGDPVTLTVRVANVGNGPAQGVRVRLWVDGVEAGEGATIERLPGGREATVVLLWLPEGHASALRVSAEASDGPTDPSPSDNEASLTAEDAQPGEALQRSAAHVSASGLLAAWFALAIPLLRRRTG